MTREQILAIAHKAYEPMPVCMMMTEDALVKFAEHITKLEREQIIKMSQAQWFKTQAEFEQAIRARGNE